MLTSSVNFLKRFFEPALSNKLSTFKLLSESSFNALWFDLIPLITIPYLTNLINTKQYENIINISIFIGILYIAIWFIHFFIRRWDVEAKYIYLDYVNKKYRRNIFLKDNLEMDKIGTGYVQSIVQSGFESWVSAIWEIIYQFPRIFSGIVAGVYITYKMGGVYVGLFLLLSSMSIYIFYFFKKKKFFYDTIVNDIENQINNDNVRMIMSREEILFANRQTKEVGQLSRLYDMQKLHDSIGAKFDFLADLAISSMAILLPFIGIVIIVGTQGGAVEATLLLAFIYFSSRFSFSLWQIVWGIKVFIERYSKIKKFWDFIDNVPQLKNYEEGKLFVHKGGEIELKNVNFHYK